MTGKGVGRKGGGKGGGKETFAEKSGGGVRHPIRAWPKNGGGEENSEKEKDS